MLYRFQVPVGVPICCRFTRSVSRCSLESSPWYSQYDVGYCSKTPPFILPRRLTLCEVRCSARSSASWTFKVGCVLDQEASIMPNKCWCNRRSSRRFGYLLRPIPDILSIRTGGACGIKPVAYSGPTRRRRRRLVQPCRYFCST
jgi:hypothetical protein